MLALEGAMDELAEKLEHGSDRAAQAQRAEDRSREGRALLVARPDACARRGCEAVRLGQAPARPGTRREGEWLIGMGVAVGGARQHDDGIVRQGRDPSGRLGDGVVGDDRHRHRQLHDPGADRVGDPGHPGREHHDVAGRYQRSPGGGFGRVVGCGVVGSAVYLACEMLRGKLAKAMGVDEDDLTLKDGKAIGDNRSTPIGELVGDGPRGDRARSSRASRRRRRRRPAYGAHFAEVAVNVVTGETRVRRMLGVVRGGAHPQREDRAVAVPGRHDLRDRRRADRGPDPRHARPASW